MRGCTYSRKDTEVCRSHYMLARRSCTLARIELVDAGGVLPAEPVERRPDLRHHRVQVRQALLQLAARDRPAQRMLSGGNRRNRYGTSSLARSRQVAIHM